MTSDISGAGRVAPRDVRVATFDNVGGARGEWNGLAVAVADDHASLIADAAEELTFAASETVERDVSERKKPREKKRVRTVAPPVEALAEMQRRMAERLAKLLARAKAAMGDPAALRQALEDFPDPTEKHAALVWLETRLSDTPSLAELATEERLRLEAEEAVAIQAGYNISGVDTGGVESAAAGRGEYRRVVLGHGEIAGMLDALLEKYGENELPDAVDFLNRAVGADLSAATPSIDKRRLEALNNDLYLLRAIGNFTRDFGAGIASLREKSGKPPLPMAGSQTLRLYCKAKNDRLVVLDSLTGTLGLEGGKDASYDVQALTRAFKLAHDLPAKLFADEDSRQRLLAAGQKLLDAAVELEESMLEE